MPVQNKRPRKLQSALVTLVVSSAFITACSTNTPLPSKRPALQEFDTTTVPAVAREDKYDPLIYCESGANGPYGCPLPTSKTAKVAFAPAPYNVPKPVLNVPQGTMDEPISDVLFDFNKSVLTPRAQQDLKALIPVMRGKALLLAGFTDSIGREGYNDKLALARAEAVRLFLRENGLTANPITIQGEGVCCYVAPNDSDDSRRLNRRVEIRLKGAKALEGADAPTLQPSANLNP